MDIAAPAPFAALLVKRFSFGSTLMFIASIPIENAKGFGHSSLAQLTGIGALAGTGLLVLLTGRLRVVSAVLVPALLFLGWAAASYSWSAAPKATISYVITAAQLVALLIVVWQQIDTPRSLRLALLSLTAGGTAGAFLTTVHRISKTGGVARYAVGDPNDFGIMIAITIVITLYLLRTTSQPLLTRMCLAAAVILQIVALGRTASRAAAIAVVAGLLILLVDRSILSTRRLIPAIIVVVGAGFSVHRLVGSDALGRIGTAVNSAEAGDLNNRTAFWHTAFGLWQHSPVHGVGAGAFKHFNTLAGKDRVAHSVFFGLLSELGVVGLLLFLLMIVAAARQLRATPPALRRLWLALFVTWLGAGVTLTFELRKMTWVLIALCASAAIAYRPLATDGTDGTDDPGGGLDDDRPGGGPPPAHDELRTVPDNGVGLDTTTWIEAGPPADRAMPELSPISSS
ncbi:MAG: hypothetical protein DLM57_18520 [Pseudonocardiales bacterium]|nr:MAG: hypothetical protein DLM57_18520 [Pseudonocardiales bacterium]